MRIIKRAKYTKTTKRERDLLALFKAKGLSNKECARKLKRSVSAIGREIKKE